MDFTEIRKLVKLVETSGIQEVEIEREGTKIRISKPSNADNLSIVPQMQTIQVPNSNVVSVPAPVETAAPLAAAPAPESKVIHHEIKSPMVGTFYSAPSPDADPYVRVGDVVKPGQVLCIVEAMKLMNEIESDVSGRIVEILGENAHPVEFGQTMFLIDTKI